MKSGILILAAVALLAACGGNTQKKAASGGGYSVRGNLLTLTPENGEGVEYYKVEENRLRRLDADKQPVTGPLAENYVLKKTE